MEQDTSGKFGEITTQFARGQIPQARGGVTQFEGSLGDRPAPVMDQTYPAAVDLVHDRK